MHAPAPRPDPAREPAVPAAGENASATRTFRNIRAPALSSLLLGAVAACGFAPLSWWPVALAAVAAWMALVHAAPSWRAAAWRGWLFGWAHFSLCNSWIQHAFDFQETMPPALGYAAPVLLSLYLALFPALSATFAWRFRGAAGPDWRFVLAFAGSWIATEWLRGTALTGYPWDPLGMLWLPTIGIARAAAWVGTYALSGLSVVAAGALLLAARGRWRVPLALAVALGALALANTGYPVRVDPTRRVRVVQPMVGQAHDGQVDSEAMWDALARWSGRPGPVPRLVLWPEGAIRDYLETGYPADAYLTPEPGGGALFSPPALTRARVARMLGPRDLVMAGSASLGFDADGNATSATNSIYTLGARGVPIGRYDKAHLVPYGEYLPMRPVLEAIGLSRLIPGDIDFVPGPGPRSAAVPGFGTVGFQLCYEIIFPGQVVDRAHRPDLIFNPSSDAWYGAWGPPQHLAQARMRAIEEGLPVLRSTPTGVSAVIDARGRVLAQVPQGKAGAIEMALPSPLPPTPFARLGNLLTALAAAALLAAAIAMRRGRS